MGRRRKSALSLRGYKNILKKQKRTEQEPTSNIGIDFNLLDFKSSSLDNSFYAREMRATLVEDGALSYEEEGFMQGYQEAEEEK